MKLVCSSRGGVAYMYSASILLSLVMWLSHVLMSNLWVISASGIISRHDCNNALYSLCYSEYIKFEVQWNLRTKDTLGTI